MQSSFFSYWIVGVCVAHLTMTSGAHAEIYKWVDEDGRTHYSESKEAAGKARAEELKFKAKSAANPEANSPAQHSQNLRIKPLEDLEQTRKRAEQMQELERSTAEKPPRSLSGGRSDGTDASRCALARDVLSGAVKHTNGEVTDSHDIKVAKNDVRKFCH